MRVELRLVNAFRGLGTVRYGKEISIRYPKMPIKRFRCCRSCQYLESVYDATAKSIILAFTPDKLLLLIASLILKPYKSRGVMVLLVSERTFNQEVLESPVPVLVNFEAPWCGLCRVIHPLLLQFQAQCGEELKLVGVNADQNFKLSNTYRLKSLPTLLLIENGNVRKRLECFSGREDLLVALDEIKASYTKLHRTYTSSKVANLA